MIGLPSWIGCRGPACCCRDMLGRAWAGSMSGISCTSRTWTCVSGYVASGGRPCTSRPRRSCTLVGDRRGIVRTGRSYTTMSGRPAFIGGQPAGGTGRSRGPLPLLRWPSGVPCRCQRGRCVLIAEVARDVGRSPGFVLATEPVAVNPRAAAFYRAQTAGHRDAHVLGSLVVPGQLVARLDLLQGDEVVSRMVTTVGPKELQSRLPGPSPSMRTAAAHARRMASVITSRWLLRAAAAATPRLSQPHDERCRRSA